MSKQKQNNKGFTLIEVLVAIALMGILATTAFSIIGQLNLAIIRANKTLAKFDTTKTVICTQLQNGNSSIYKCVGIGK